MPDEIIDKTTEVIDDPDEKEATADDKIKAPAGDQDDPKYQAALKAQETLNDLMEEHGFDSMEDLTEELNSGKSLKEILGGRDAAKSMKQVETLESYEEYWAMQEETRKREEETETDTVKRLEKRALEAEKALKIRDNELHAAKEAEIALSAFNSDIKNFLKSEEVPDEYRGIFAKFMGVDNPFNEIDITDKAAVRKFAKTMKKELLDHEQAVIKRYRKGKTDTPVITKTGIQPAGEPHTFKTMEERASVMKSLLTKHFRDKEGG